MNRLDRPQVSLRPSRGRSKVDRLERTRMFRPRNRPEPDRRQRVVPFAACVDIVCQTIHVLLRLRLVVLTANDLALF